MTTSTNSDNSQQVPQLLQHERSTLPLLYLPYELAEETSLYFEPKEAARVLSVNRSFYNLFIPRAWHDLQYCCKYGDRKNLEEWFKKYGQYVRVVKPLRPAISQLGAIVDWIPFVNRATKLVALFDKRAPPDGITKILQYLQQIKSLRTSQSQRTDGDCKDGECD
ncbi:hypothetical protein GQ42DRAFT_175806 [Ramicandelaber brevisporus]|nr:hypothetical protein GQ42DRAFT_175806 [Ramicandelaber brevisporus]